MRVPHQFSYNGEVYTVRWGNPSDKEWNPKELFGMIVYKTRVVTLNPSIRGDKRLSLGVFFHEVWHAIDRRITHMKPGARFKMYRSQSVARWTMPHPMYNRVAYPLAEFLIENDVQFTCRCKACLKKAGKNALRGAVR